MKLPLDEVEEIRFVVVTGASPGSKVPFEPGVRSIRIGRAVDNEIVINDPRVSRAHVRIDIRQEGTFICDLGSSTGVEKMGFRVGTTPEPLESGDEFKIGDTVLRFDVVAKRGAMKRVARAESGAAASASPIQRLFARIGLQNPIMQVAAVVAIGVVAGLALWPSGPALPPQSSDPLPLNYDAAIGFNSSDQSHLDAAVFSIPTDSEGLGIYFDFIGGSEVDIRTRTQEVAKLAPTSDWHHYELFVIPRALGAGGPPQVIFDNLAYSPADRNVDPAKLPQWAITKMWPSRVASTAASPGVLANELGALRELADRRADDPKNPYSLLKGLRASTLGLMKIAGKQAQVAQIPIGGDFKEANVGEIIGRARAELEKQHLDKSLEQLLGAVSQAEGQFERDYRRLFNVVLLARNRQAVAEQQEALQAILAMVPEPVDPRQRWATAELRKLGGGG
jgi:FHA domain